MLTRTRATAFILKPDLHVKLYVRVRADVASETQLVADSWVDGSAFSSKTFENLWKINQVFRLSLLLCRC